MYSVGNYIMENEIWKDIPEYVGYYQSNQNGDIKSLQRITIYNDGRKKVQKEKILKHYNRGKYKKVDLCKHGVVKKHYVHLLVFFSFLNWIFTINCKFMTAYHQSWTYGHFIFNSEAI